MDKLLKPFYGEGASSSTYEPANLLIIQDNSPSMKRTMDLLAMFDADSFAGQRVKLYDVENSQLLLPLYQGIELIRALATGTVGAFQLVNVAYMLAMGSVGMWLASRRIHKLLLK